MCLSIAIALGAAGPADAEPQTVDAHGHAFHAAGTLFERSGHYRAFDDAARRQFLAMGGADAAFAAAERDRVAALSADQLAEAYVRAYRRLRAVELRMAWMRRLIDDGAALDRALRAATVEGQGGDAPSRPLTEAIAHDVVRMSLMAERLAEETPHPAFAGAYRAEIAGESCPVAAGAVEVIRRGALFEARRGDTAVLAGAVGQDRVAAVAAEQLRGRVDRDRRDDPVLEMPFDPQSLYLGPAGRRVPFRTDGGGCTITLVPAG